jgi:hypothetical protein
MMSIWLHTAILATGLAATVAVGIASATIYENASNRVAAKADRLPVVGPQAAYVTVETRGDGVSELSRTPIDSGN